MLMAPVTSSLKNNLFCANNATDPTTLDGGGGGGLLAQPSATGSHVWNNNAFVENTSDEFGGGLSINEWSAINPQAEVRNNIFVANVTTPGSGAPAVTPGGSAANFDGSNVNFENNIVAWNKLAELCVQAHQRRRFRK